MSDNGIKFGSYSRIPQLIWKLASLNHIRVCYKRREGRCLTSLDARLLYSPSWSGSKAPSSAVRDYKIIEKHDRQQRYMLRYFWHSRDKRQLLGPSIYNSHTWFDSVVELFVEVRHDTNIKLQTSRIKLIKSLLDVSQTEPRNAWHICGSHTGSCSIE
ncbi:hypothetical protein LIPSTDRAFT_72532 [Lipomyces starkeyi NRRL Y-11557]|uniref:Uncharacterized protein n=1 Tax=Lipomyces starkeyi NRRL Y-11557 TaxID=675824 RepID=A0A1E3Q3X9_LIPST|nr:hypothetical protein LIPSTDRAFT_72532 [Lipomyces starkeyi NRRL Y-11557]